MNLPRFIKAVTVANPAAGADFSYTVDALAAVQLLHVRAKLVTSGVAGSRSMVLRCLDGANVIAYYPAATSHAASLTRTYSIAHFGVIPAPTTLNNIIIAISELIYLYPGFTIESLIDTKDAGDQLSEIVLLLGSDYQIF